MIFKKIIIIYLLIVMLFNTMACGRVINEDNKENKDITKELSVEFIDSNDYYFQFVDYDIKQKVLKLKKEIAVSYPVLTSFLNDTEDELQFGEINKIIKEDIIEVVNKEISDYSEKNISKGGFVCKYVVRHYSEHYISIQYDISYYFGGAYDVERIHTINIDLINKKKLSLGDIINLDDLKETFYKSVIESIPDEYDQYIDKDDFISNNSDFYFDHYNFTICLQVLRIAGYHMEFNIKYNDIKEYFKDQILKKC